MNITPDNNDNNLSERLRNGEASAIEELFTRYFKQVYSVIFHAVGRNTPVAEDITQETFLSATKSAIKFKGNSKPYTWLLSIAHHKIVDYYRDSGRKRRYETWSLESSIEEQAALLSNSEPLYSHLESIELSSVISDAMLKLPYHYREVLLYKYVEEMPVKEIGRVMGRSSKSIEALLSRARSILKNELENSK